MTPTNLLLTQSEQCHYSLDEPTQQAEQHSSVRLPSYHREAQEGHDGRWTQGNIFGGPQEAVDETTHKSRVEPILWGT